MNLLDMKRWSELNGKKKEIGAELKKVKDEMEELAPLIMSSLIEDEVPKITVGNYTLYMKTDTYIGIKAEVEIEDPETKETSLVDGLDHLRDLLLSHGFSSIVKPGTADLKSLVKSFKDAGQDIPEWLEPSLVINTKTKLAAKKA